ncbi:MAG: STAS domain-containing protein [Pseudomonadota bacterium]
MEFHLVSPPKGQANFDSTLTDERKTTDRQTVTLDRRCDVAKARPLAEKLLSLRGNELTLDVSEVEYIGVQCLQVIFAAKKTWETDGNGFAIKEKSCAFVDALTHIGMRLPTEADAPGKLCL